MKKNDKIYLIFQSYDLDDPVDLWNLTEQAAFLTKAGAKKFLLAHIKSMREVELINQEKDTFTVQSKMGKKAIWYYQISWIRVF